LRISLNFAAGLANSVWSAIVSFVAVPFYIKYLGIEAYGLIGYFITLQAVMQLLDVGLSPTINREVARCMANDQPQDARNLLHTLAYIYWGTALAIAVLLYLGSTLIADHWLQSNQLPKETVVEALILMGLIIAARWPVGLYSGAIIGAQRLTISSSVSILAITFGNIGAVLILAFVSPTISAFFLWQAAIGIIYALTMRKAAWLVVGKSAETRIDLDYLKSVWHFSAGMAGVAVASVILIQSDKVILSRLLSLEDFGRYTLATVAASALYVLLTPLFNTIYPQLTKLVSNNNTEKLLAFYRNSTRIFLALLIPITATVTLYSQELVYLWTGNEELSFQVAPLVSVLISGTALNGVMLFPYALQLANGKYQIALKITLILICITIPTLLLLTDLYGPIGGASTWLITNSLYLIIGTYLTHRQMLTGYAIRWLTQDVGIPMILSYAIVISIGFLLKFQDFSALTVVLLAIPAMLLTSFALLFYAPMSRKLITEHLQSSRFRIFV
jgi:O-antigen/teichoic acid export membrane protein